MKTGILVIGMLFLITISAKGADVDRFVPSTPPNTTDIVIIDSVTGLMWQKDYTKGCSTCVCNTQPCQWKDALAFCESLDYGTYKDWRLLNVKELSSLINFNKYNPASDFPEMPSYLFWSSSAYVSGTNVARVVSFGSGYVLNDDKAGTDYVRCVRGGP